MKSLSSLVMRMTWSQTITLWDRSVRTKVISRKYCQASPNEEKRNFLEIRDGRRTYLRKVHSVIPLCIHQHSELTIREQTYYLQNEINKCHTDSDDRDSPETARSDVPVSILLQTSTQHEKALILSTTTSHNNFPLLSSDIRATEQGVRFLSTERHDNVNVTSRQESSRSSLDWKFCIMNMTVFSTQHLTIFPVGCRVCDFWWRVSLKLDRYGPEKEWKRKTVASYLDCLWQLYVRTGKRDQETLRLLQDQRRSCNATSETLSSTEKTSSYGHSGVGENTQKLRKLEQLLRDFFQFLSGLDVVSITILTDPKITAHLSGRALGNRWDRQTVQYWLKEATVRARIVSANTRLSDVGLIGRHYYSYISSCRRVPAYRVWFNDINDYAYEEDRVELQESWVRDGAAHCRPRCDIHPDKSKLRVDLDHVMTKRVETLTTETRECQSLSAQACEAGS